MNLLFDTPWWLPTTLAFLGIALFWNGNRRTDAKLRNVGLALLLAAVAVVAVSHFIDTDIERAEKQSKRLVRSVDGAENAGAVLFQPLPDGRTQVTMRMRYNPEGLKEHVGDALGFVGRRVQGDLHRFAAFMEERQSATGAWRGEIHGQKVRG